MDKWRATFLGLKQLPRELKRSLPSPPPSARSLKIAADPSCN